MDTTIRIFHGITIFKRKCGHTNWFFHADSNPMYRLVSSIYKTCKRRFEFKFIHPSTKFNFTDITSSNLFSDFLFKWKFNGLYANHLLNINCNCNSFCWSTDYQIPFKWNNKRKSDRYHFIFGDLVFINSCLLYIFKSRKSFVW